MTQTPTDALRLVPCPFCGGDVINTRSQEMTKGPAYYWHQCETCGAESEGDYGEDVAVAAWNRRAAPASPLPLAAESDPILSSTDLADRRASPLPGGGWQDISTAPKNGTEVLVMLKPKVIRLGWYFKPSSRTEGWCDENGKRIIPSHWMPLPAAPTGDA